MTAEETIKGMNSDDNVRKMPEAEYRFAPSIKLITPEEAKAKDIFKIYWEMFLFDNDISTEETWGKIAKKASLLCVEELINEAPENWYNSETKQSMKNYYQKVKQHLINL